MKREPTETTSSPSFAQSVVRDAKENHEKKMAARKEGLPPKPNSLNYALLSRRKNMIGLC